MKTENAQDEGNIQERKEAASQKQIHSSMKSNYIYWSYTNTNLVRERWIWLTGHSSIIEGRSQDRGIQLEAWNRNHRGKLIILLLSVKLIVKITYHIHAHAHTSPGKQGESCDQVVQRKEDPQARRSWEKKAKLSLLFLAKTTWVFIYACRKQTQLWREERETGLCVCEQRTTEWNRWQRHNAINYSRKQLKLISIRKTKRGEIIL